MQLWFLLAHTLAKRVSELHGLSFHVWHSLGWKSCTFSYVRNFVANTQNPSLHDPRFNEFTALSLDDSVSGDRDEFLLCPIHVLRQYLAWTEKYHPGVPDLFVSTSKRKKRCPKTPFCFRLDRSSTSAEILRVQAHEVWKVTMSLLYRKNCAIHQVLKAGTWSSQNTFSAFYLQDVTHRHIDTFSISYVVAAQQVM